MNLNYQNTIPNIYSIPFQAQRIIEPQNFNYNRISNFNTSNSSLFNANQNYYPNQMLPPNNYNNYSPFNDLRQNIFPDYFSQFNNSSPYNIIEELYKKVIGLEKIIQQNQKQSLDYSQFKFYGNEEKDAYKKKIYLTYKANLNNANDALINNQKKVFDSKVNLEIKDIIIYITTNKDIKFVEKLNKNNAVAFKDLKIPEITYEMIEKKIKNVKYKWTEEDIKVLKDCENNSNLKYQIYYNKYMFYSQNKISLFTPHIIRTKKNIISLFFTERLNLSDFQYNDSHKNINNDVFLQLLSLRINEFNDYEKEDGIITDEKYNEKIFGFNKNISGTNFYLYSIMDEKIISEKINNININTLFENLAASESQIDLSKKPISYNSYEIFNRNMNFLKGLTYEELILYIILNILKTNMKFFQEFCFMNII